MSILNYSCRKSWLLVGFCIGLAGGVQAGTMGETGSGSGSMQQRSGMPQGSPSGSMGATGSGGSQEGSGTSQGTTGSSQGITGSPEGSSGTSRGTSGTSGSQPGGSSSMGSSQGMGKIQPFQSVDKNKDNYVTKSELMDSPSLLDHFDRSDANKDGQLDENEYKNIMMENQR